MDNLQKKETELEWIKLIEEAKQIGLTTQEVRQFLNKITSLSQS